MKSRSAPITEDELNRAVRKFVRNGGLIRQLPPQVTPSRPLVGGHLAAFESLPIASDVLDGKLN